MKKALVILALLAATGSLSAQDTILSDSPSESYFYNHWLGHDTVLPVNTGILASQFIEEAYAYHSDAPLQVYGIAVSLTWKDDMATHPWRTYLDTSMDNSYRTIRLYTPSGDTLLPLAEQRVHVRESRVSYYFALDMTDSRSGSAPEPIAVYECYFDHPVTVQDTFYVGYNYENSWYGYDTTTREYYYNERYHAYFNGFLELGITRMKEPMTKALRLSPSDPDYEDDGVWFFETRYANQPHYFLYAITTPQDSTSGGGGDNPPVSILGNDAVARYVDVLPNPATEQAQVTSSFGLTRIEAYDADGRKVGRFVASGYKTTLDVTAWPAGTYLLRITTPMGAVTKKLLVR